MDCLLARALSTDPKLIALDEPAAGMNSTEKVVLRELIDRIRKDGAPLAHAGAAM